MTDFIITKTCSKCRKSLPVISFHRDKYRHDGLNPSCKTCKQKVRQKTRKKPFIINEKLIERLFDNTLPFGDCLLWQGMTNHKGYGRISFQSRLYMCHRLSYEINFGKIPNGLIVCHKCDVRNCINPEHLFLGTDKDNVVDKFQKGRENYKLNQNLADQIRKEYATEKCSYPKLAAKYAVNEATIRRVVIKQNWNHS